MDTVIVEEEADILNKLEQEYERRVHEEVWNVVEEVCMYGVAIMIVAILGIYFVLMIRR